MLFLLNFSNYYVLLKFISNSAIVYASFSYLNMKIMPFLSDNYLSLAKLSLKIRKNIIKEVANRVATRTVKLKFIIVIVVIGSITVDWSLPALRFDSIRWYSLLWFSRYLLLVLVGGLPSDPWIYFIRSADHRFLLEDLFVNIFPPTLQMLHRSQSIYFNYSNNIRLFI